MPDVLSTTGPIYLLIALGYAAVRGGAFEPAAMRVLGRFVMLFCLPALLFDAVSRRRVAEVLQAPYIAAYAFAALAVGAAGFAWARWRRGAPVSLAAIQGMGMCSSNSGFVGYPILQQMMGPVAGTLLAVTMLVENLIVIPLFLALADAGGHGSARRAFVQSMKSLATNPMLLAIAAGLACGLADLQLTGIPARTVQLLASASSPLALFVIGGSLVGVKLGGVRGDIARVAFGKLVLHPLALFAALSLLPTVDPTLRLGALVLAAMPMLGIYPVLAQKHHHERFAAPTLVITTALSFFTLSAGLAWLRQHPGWLP